MECSGEKNNMPKMSHATHDDNYLGDPHIMGELRMVVCAHVWMPKTIVVNVTV